MRFRSISFVALLLFSAAALVVSPSMVLIADDTCSQAAGNECDAASDLIDLADDNPIVDATGEPDRAQDEIEDQPDYSGGSDNSSDDE